MRYAADEKIERTNRIEFTVGERIEFKAILPRRITIGPEGDSMDMSFATEHWQKGYVIGHENALYDVNDESGITRSVPEYKIRALHTSESAFELSH